MTLDEFIDNANGAPWELTEFAEEALKVSDCAPLKDCATAFLKAKQDFEQALANHDVEMG